jgi:predicted nucleotidyltransferase
MVMSESLIEQVRLFFERDATVRLALLFGSYAAGRAHAASDVDVAVAYQQKLSLDERVRIGQALSLEINKEVDLVDLREAGGVLLQQILAKRKTLVNRDPELYGNLIAKRVTEEADFMPLYERILQERRERFIHGRKGR